MERHRAIPGPCAYVLLGAPFSFEWISGICSLLDSDAVDEVRSHSAERRASPTLIGFHQQTRLSWYVFQRVFFPLHRFIFGGGENLAVRARFTRVSLQNGCPGLGRKLVAGPAYWHPVPAIESE